MIQIARTRQFDKHAKKRITGKLKRIYKKRLLLFIEDPYNPTLYNHELKWDFQGYRTFDITADFKIMFEIIDKNRYLFVDCGTHNQLYNE